MTPGGVVATPIRKPLLQAGKRPYSYLFPWWLAHNRQSINGYWTDKWKTTCLKSEYRKKFIQSQNTHCCSLKKMTYWVYTTCQLGNWVLRTHEDKTETISNRVLEKGEKGRHLNKLYRASRQRQTVKIETHEEGCQGWREGQGMPPWGPVAAADNWRRGVGGKSSVTREGTQRAGQGGMSC